MLTLTCRCCLALLLVCAATVSRAEVPYPRIAMLWAPLRGDWSPESYARHDLVMVGAGSLRLRPNAEPAGLASGFTEASKTLARQRIAEIRRLNPDVVLLADLPFYEYAEDWLPEDHPWWLRKDGQRLQFWPGTYRMDWNQPDYRANVVQQTSELQQLGVDGVFYDNLRTEPEPWVAFLSAVRAAVGDEFLLLANSGYAVGEHDFVAPFLNGFMYESGWSHQRTEWDELIRQLQHTETLLREPRISLIERFAEIRNHAGWPGDAKRDQAPDDDVAARHWSLCFSLTVGDFYYLFSDNTSHKHDWHAEYDRKIGLPAAPGRRLGPHAWTRRYTSADVYVNLPGAIEPFVVETGEEVRDLLSEKVGRSFTIAPGDGAILRRAELPE